MKMMVSTATRFSVTVYAPVLILFILLALFLIPEGVLFTLIAISDPTIPLSSAIRFDMWIIGPVLIAVGLFIVGRGLYSLHLHRHAPRVVWLITWVIFSITLFLALWMGFIIFTSIGASETPPHIFLSLTASLAAGSVFVAQAFVIPWLVFISRMLHRSFTIDSAEFGKKNWKINDVENG